MSIDFVANADMMSDMKTFTVRDLDRTPSRVLDACDREGGAIVRRRDGRSYRLIREVEVKPMITGLPDFAARRRKIFPKKLPASFARELDRAIRGE